jgi:hypothetical protein
MGAPSPAVITVPSGGRTRPGLRTLVLLALLGAACSSPGDGGAVLVRWRLLVGPTGVPHSDCSISEPSLGIDVTVDTLRLIVSDLPPAPPDEVVTLPPFRCIASEGTTPFKIPPGDYQLRLQAYACGGQRSVGLSPPPLVRSVRLGEITNLGAIAILIPPCETIRCDQPETPPTCDGGTTP